MKISYAWLQELSGVRWPVTQAAERLTLCGLACESIEPTDRYLGKVVVGEVREVRPIPGADKIKQAVVDTGSEICELVCGAPNVAVGQKVPVALEGAVLAGNLTVKKVKIRGIESRGMICSERELGLSDDHSGIMVLDPTAKLGRPVVDELDYDDYILDFDITPNRGDALSAIGIARDLAALAGTRISYPDYKLKATGRDVNAEFSAASDDHEACPRFTARIIRNVTLRPSPWWLRKRLLACGVRPISNVVDVTNYIMLETGNPIHAFDLDRFGSNKVVVRRARQGEKLVTLDGKEHTLSPEVLLITNDREGKAAAGVMGGFDSEVSEQTRNLLLEVAYFAPSVIRRSRKQLGLVTEASSRFERGVDPNNLPTASARAAYLLQELCGGEVFDGLVDVYPHKIEPRAIALRPRRCNDVLGTAISSDRMRAILTGLECKVSGDDPLKVEVPTFRGDLSREIDLIEEVARIEGYSAIPDSTANKGPLYAPTHPAYEFEQEVRTVLTAAGCDEILGHGLADSRLSRHLNPDLPQVRILNPVSEDLDIVRNDLAYTALQAISHNLAHRNLDLRLFEIGKAYLPPDEIGEWREKDGVLVAVTGETPRTWRDRSRPVDFYDLTGILGRLAAHLRCPDLSFEQDCATYFEAERTYAVLSAGRRIGQAGLVKEDVARRFEIKQPVYLAQLRLAELSAAGSQGAKFNPLPVYPAATRDLALVVDRQVQVAALTSCIREVAGALAESVEVFDLYVGKQVGDRKKSVAVAISFRSSERSLANDEVDAMQEKIVAELKRRFNASLRDF